MPKEIGWSQEAYLLAQVKALLARVGSMSPVTGGITSLNGLTDATQTFAVGTAGTGLTITSSAGVHTFNIPNASATAKGLLTAVDWSTFSNKLGGTGTVNYISKFTASGTIGNSQIFDNGTNVGIGTASPLTNLHIFSASNSEVARLQFNGSAPYLSFWSSASRNGYIQFDNSAGALYINETNSPSIFYNNNVERMRITSGGNMGIGTSTPDARLDVSNTITSDYTSAARFRNTDPGAGNFRNVAIEFWDRYQTVNAAIIGARNTVAGNWQGDLVFKVAQGASPSTDPSTLTEVMRFNGQVKRIQFLPDGTERMRLTSDAKLLINTTTDAGAYALQVAGSIYNTTGAVLAASSGDVAIKTTSLDGGVQLQVGNNGNRINLARIYGNIDVMGATAGGSATAPAIFINGDSNSGLYWIGGDVLAMSTGGVNSMTWFNNGNVGIGTTSPATKLELSQATDNTDGPIIRLSNNANTLSAGQLLGGLQFYSGDDSGGGDRVQAQISVIQPSISPVGGTMTFSTNAEGGAAITERMRIQSDGRIGIGTSSSLVAQLTIREPAIGGAGAEVLRFVGNSSNADYMRSYWVSNAGTTLAQMSVNGIVDMLFGTLANMPLALYTNNIERMRITAGGNVLIGTTTDVGVALNVNGNIRVSNTIDSVGDIVLRSLNSNTRVYIGDVNTVNNQMIIGNNGSSAFTFVGNNFGISQTTFGTNATKTLAISTGVAPTTSPVDAIQMYSADVVAGNAAPHFRTENGAVVKVYQETTGVAAATRVGGGGATVTDTDTFDGYTIAKLVKALRNQGLLA